MKRDKEKRERENGKLVLFPLLHDNVVVVICNSKKIVAILAVAQLSSALLALLCSAFHLSRNFFCVASF